MPKNREVASLVGNLSPVKRRSAIFVRSIRHFRGDTGEELNNRATCDQRGLAAYRGSIAHPPERQMSYPP